MNTKLINGEPQDINELTSIEALITEQRLRSAQIAVELNGKIIPKSSHAETLVEEYFDVMVYTSDDPLVAKSLGGIGCVAVMPLGAPIGSGLGIRNPYTIRITLKNAKVPIIVDAGVGTASDASLAMELDCDGVLMNTAIAEAEAKEPMLMASVMKKDVEAGREAYLAGRMPRRLYTSASSPVDGTFF